VSTIYIKNGKFASNWNFSNNLSSKIGRALSVSIARSSLAPAGQALTAGNSRTKPGSIFQI
jgi:hypothetical protein